MNPEQIKDKIRKLNWVDKIGLYRWINEEIAGPTGIGADRAFQIREELERICKSAYLKTNLIDRGKSESIDQSELPGVAGPDADYPPKVIGLPPAAALWRNGMWANQSRNAALPGRTAEKERFRAAVSDHESESGRSRRRNSRG
jgi:hypothetical protein